MLVHFDSGVWICLSNSRFHMCIITHAVCGLKGFHFQIGKHASKGWRIRGVCLPVMWWCQALGKPCRIAKTSVVLLAAVCEFPSTLEITSFTRLSDGLQRHWGMRLWLTDAVESTIVSTDYIENTGVFSRQHCSATPLVKQIICSLWWSG